MSRLTVYSDDAPREPEAQTDHGPAIASALAAIGVTFERWTSPVAIAADEAADQILEAYRPYLDRLMGTTGAGSADVVKLSPDNPQAAELREKFLHEHVHTEAEVRFFVQGSGNFILHVGRRVYDVHCAEGDLIGVPAGMKHWFDAGEQPRFTALRVFTNPDGWVAHFSGDAISERFAAR